jgi:GT2 family glycosyltransferase
MSFNSNGHYNGAKYIQEQLDSLSNQSLLPFELVVCDDSSTDDSSPSFVNMPSPHRFWSGLPKRRKFAFRAFF